MGYLVKGDKVLLARRKASSVGLGLNIVAGIGGKNENGESDKEALVREVFEEIGVKVASARKMGRVIFFFPNKPKWNQDVAIYLITKWKGIPKESDSMAPEWFSIKNLPKKQMWDDNRYWIPCVLNGEKVRFVFLYGEDNRVSDFVSF